jgi:hypothetical protein
VTVTQPSLSRPEARRLAWGLIMQGLQIEDEGLGSVSDSDTLALAQQLQTPADWGLICACLVAVACDTWTHAYDHDLSEARRQAARVALNLAAE